jgi:hypothetical protein
MNKFYLADFQDPPALHWPGYFWVLNDRIDEATLMAQLQDMREHGARSVCLLPEPPEFRPDSLATRLDRPYLSKSYFDMIRKIVEECHRLGMNYWLYDEGGWPSGGACGQVCAQNPEAFAGQVMANSEKGPVVKNASYGCVPYPNLLNSEATKTFIKLTHGGHKKSVGEYFGNTLRFAFTDEPLAFGVNSSQLTWTDDFAEVFQQRKGYDLRPYLAELLKEFSADEHPELTKVLVDYHDIRSQLFVERFLWPIRDWCRENGLLSAGHFGGEDEPSGNAFHGFGHILRALRGLDLPGVDVIWRQLFPGGRSHQFPKYASSAARQKNQPYVLTESFAVYGNGLFPGQMKWLIDQQFVRGCSLLVGACYPYSTRDHFLAGERPHFGPNNPLWKYMDIFHAYTARLSYLLTRGRPVCSTAVYYDVRSIWAGGKFRERASLLHDQLANVILKAQCDFDYIDDDLLAGIGAAIERGSFSVGPMRYDTIIVPATPWMDRNALKDLAKFLTAGGKVITVEGLPFADGGKTGLSEFLDKNSESRMIQVNLEQVPSVLEPPVRLEPACPDIRVCKRTWDNTALYFLTNEADRTINMKITFREKGIPLLVDPETGGRVELPSAGSEKGKILDLEFSPWGSLVILFGDEHERMPTEFISGECISLPETGWTIRPVRQYRIGENDIEVTDLDQTPVSAAPGNWSAYLGSNFSGDAEYTIEFTCDSHQAGRSARLDLGQVNYVCRVFLNERELGRKIWRPFIFDPADALRPGKNRLRIVVTNTLANTLLDPAVEAQWDARKGVTWPAAEGFHYDKMTRKFERDSLPSGLFGPVKIIFNR